MTDTLKPVRCGCGGEAKINKTSETGFAVYCDQCIIHTGLYHHEEDAIEAWNTAMGTNHRTLMRVLAHDATCAVCEKKKERTVKVDTRPFGDIYLYKCHNCQYYVDKSFTYCPGCGARLEWE